jgi:hypothetical protein
MHLRRHSEQGATPTTPARSLSPLRAPYASGSRSVGSSSLGSSSTWASQMATATPYKSPPARVSPPDLLLTPQHAVPPQPTRDAKITDDQTPTLNNAQRRPTQSQVPLSMPEQCVEANSDDGEEINASATGAEVEATGEADTIVEKKAKTTVAAAKPTTSTASAKATAPPPATPPTTAEKASEASSTTTRRQTRSMSAAASGVVPTGTQAAAASGKAAASSSSANNPTARTRSPRKKGRPQRAICLSPTPGYESLSLRVRVRV